MTAHRLAWEVVYWPIAVLTGVAWVACELTLQAHDWAQRKLEATK